MIEILRLIMLYVIIPFAVMGAALVLSGTFFTSNIVLFMGLYMLVAVLTIWIIVFACIATILFCDIRRNGWNLRRFGCSSYNK